MTSRLLRSCVALLLPVAVACGGSDAPTAVAPSTSACAGLVLPGEMSVGEVRVVPSGSRTCIQGSASAADYAFIAYNGDSANAASLTVVGDSLVTPPSASVLGPSAPTASTGSFGAATSTLSPDLAFHARQLRAGEVLGSRIADARRLMATRNAVSASPSGGFTPSGVSRSTIPATAQVGDIIRLNVNGAGDCTTIDIRPTRVVAIGSKSIVLADTTNPKNGFTTADYQRFATNFDTLIYPLDVGYFGAPSDLDANGKVAILFTRAVNEETTANSNTFVAGYFADRDLFPKTSTSTLSGCAGSNEAEMFYMLAPDPTGVVNGNTRTTIFVDSLTVPTLAHEFQHLINAARRMYVSTTANTFEVGWLNEGLSHVAEELLYYRTTGKSPRNNLTDANIRVESFANYQVWKQDLGQNFTRFSNYLQNPAANSLDAANDDQATRGATWAFLRYAADRFYTTDSDVWFKLVNSPTKGFGTLRLAFGNDPVGVIRDWTVANYTDDRGITTDPRYLHASWNYRDIYTRTFLAGVYPLKVTGLANGASTSVSIQQNSASYYRLSLAANRDAQVRAASGGAAPSAALQFVLVRTK